MREFMYTHLGVSLEVLETTTEEAASIAADAEPVSPPPPPAKIVGRVEAQQQSTLAKVLDAKQEEIKNRALDVVSRVARSAGGSKSGGTTSPTNHEGSPEPITAEQSARGLAGEEEIKRRLCLAGGWEGFVFLRDTRSERCGFDCEVQHGDRIVKLEVKTFTPDGRVIVTNRELQAAAEYKSEYYLIGVLDSDSVPRAHWTTFLMRDPLLTLMSLGQFIVEAKLQVDADELFEFKTDAADSQ
jgi:Domain of unknown function (DUF3883)